MGGTLLNLLLVGCLLLSPSSNLHPAFKASRPPRSGEEQRGDTADQGRPPTRPPSAGHGPPRPSVDLLCFGAHGAWLAGVSCPVRFGLHVELGPRPPAGRASEFMAIHHAQGQRPRRAQAARAQAARAQACLDYSSGSRWPQLTPQSGYAQVAGGRQCTHLDPVRTSTPCTGRKTVDDTQGWFFPTSGHDFKRRLNLFLNGDKRGIKSLSDGRARSC